MLALLFLTAATMSVPNPPATIAPDLGKVTDGKTWRVVNGAVRVTEEKGKPVVHLSPTGGDRKGSNVALALVEGAELAEGTFEIDLRGDPAGKASFVGVVFNATEDGKTHEAVYFRPFNFKSDDPVRRAHAVQYVAWPEHTWEKLRAEKPGAYESAVAPIPDPLGWFHARIEVTASRVNVFVDGATRPCLSVDRLSGGKGGKAGGRVGLWVDSKEGSFAGFKILRSR